MFHYAQLSLLPSIRPPRTYFLSLAVFPQESTHLVEDQSYSRSRNYEHDKTYNHHKQVDYVVSLQNMFSYWVDDAEKEICHCPCNCGFANRHFQLAQEQQHGVTYRHKKDTSLTTHTKLSEAEEYELHRRYDHEKKRSAATSLQSAQNGHASDQAQTHSTGTL